MLIRRKTMLSVVMHDINVIQTHTNLVSSRVVRYKAYTASVVCDEGYSIYEITIKIGGVDITSTAYDATYNMISIPSVTGDVDIVCYAMHSIPSDYIRVDGIKNPSNAYMDTGYYVTPNNRLELHMSIEKLSITTYHATSKRGISGAIGSGWYTSVSAYAIQANVNDTSVSLGLDTTQHIGEYYEFILDYYKKVSHIKGYNSKTLPEKTSTDPNTFVIFASPENYGNAPNRVVKYFRIYDYSTNAYVRYYIPCLNASGVAGFWDAARGVFQGSSNSTAFEAVNNYISDGLVFHLDGVDKGATADAWTDKVGGYVFTKTGNVEAIDKGWSLGGTVDDYLFCSNHAHPVGQNLTVEVCFKPERTGNEMIFGTCNRAANKALFYKKGNELLFMQDNNTYTYETVADTKYTISLNQTSGFVNMQRIEKDETTDYITFAINNYTYIGVRRTTSAFYVPFKGEIYSIRIYNRQLTADEQKHNQIADNLRFGLGLL